MPVDPDQPEASESSPEPAPEREVAREPEPENEAPIPSEPMPSRVRPGPLAAAQEALDRAAAARGVKSEAPRKLSRDPLAAAREALAKAEDALNHAEKGGRAGLAREANARAQLDALKGIPSSAPRSGPSRENSDERPPPPVAKKRTL